MDLRPPDGDESNTQLVELIAAEIASSGPISFARFMKVAIGHPEHGYYAASVDRVGTGGDFLTAPETHPIFGWLLARQVIECWELLGSDPQLDIRELGAGRGTLARQILDAIQGLAPAGLESVSYELFDLNPAHVTPGAPGESESESIQQTLVEATDEPIRGVTVANEYLDALPFHRVVRQEGKLQELYVDFEDGWFVERAGEIAQEVRSMGLNLDTLEEGQIAEVSPAVQEAIRLLGERLEHGFAILVDYGYEQPERYAAARFPQGSLKTYRQHEVGENPFIHIGQQDITAHVDFSLVVDTAEAAGLKSQGLTTLAEFCAGLGLDEVLMEIQSAATEPDDYLAARTAAMALLDPAGLGRFKVIVLSKALDPELGLSGLSFRMPGF